MHYFLEFTQIKNDGLSKEQDIHSEQTENPKEDVAKKDIVKNDAKKGKTLPG